MKIAQALGLESIGMPVTSDIIESLFSVLKRLGVSQIKDANRIALKTPVLCGEITEQDARRVLDVTVAQQNQQTGANNSLIRQRRQILPNPGNLSESILAQGENLTLLPGAKNRSKNTESCIISDGSAKIGGP